jgi:hypothetical protein
VLVVRLLVTLASAGAVVTALRAPPQRNDRRFVVFACPMHPEVTSTSQGTCPICGMELEPTASLRPPAAASPMSSSDLAGTATTENLLYTAEVRAPARVARPGVVVAHVYDDELPWIRPPARGSFSPSRSADARVEITSDGAEPSTWDASTSRVEFRVDSAGVDLPVGTVGWVTFAADPRRALMVPSAGILHDAQGAYVVARRGEESYGRQSVHVGKILNRHAFVVSGLKEGDRIAVNSAFVIDADRRVREIANAASPAGP